MTTILPLAEELDRFETAMAERFPKALAQLNPGLDGAGVLRFRERLDPAPLPPDVETLYRWHDGGPTVFAGWTLYPLERLIVQRQFAIESLGHPPAWLAIFDAHGPGFVDLGAPGIAADRSVWWSYSHDVGVYRLFDSLAHLVATCSDLIEAGRIEEGAHGLAMVDGATLASSTTESVRLARSPGCYRTDRPPAGTVFDSFPEYRWPESWLLSVGLESRDRALRGASSTVRAVIDASRSSDVHATVVGRIDRAMMVGHSYTFTLTDRTGELAVTTDTATTGFRPVVGARYEIDVVVHAATVPAEPVSSSDRLIDELVSARIPRATPATGIALRPVE